MAECVLILSMTEKCPATTRDLIGVERGALMLASEHRKMTLAVGDFDSVTEEERKLIEEYAENVISLNKVKDDSDSEAAIRYVLSHGYDRVYVYGAFGGRLDHEIVNLRLAAIFPNQVTLVDDQNVVCALKKGSYQLKRNAFTYISFFAPEKAVISLRGMKYPLYRKTMTYADLFGLSNEIKDEEGILNVHEGTILMIPSRDKK